MKLVATEILDGWKFISGNGNEKENTNGGYEENEQDEKSSFNDFGTDVSFTVCGMWENIYLF